MLRTRPASDLERYGYTDYGVNMGSFVVESIVTRLQLSIAALKATQSAEERCYVIVYLPALRDEWGRDHKGDPQVLRMCIETIFHGKQKRMDQDWTVLVGRDLDQPEAGILSTVRSNYSDAEILVRATPPVEGAPVFSGFRDIKTLVLR